MERRKSLHRSCKQKRSSSVGADSSRSSNNGLAPQVDQPGPPRSKRRKPATPLESPSTSGENQKHKGTPSFVPRSSTQKPEQDSSVSTEFTADVEVMVETGEQKVRGNMHEDEVGDAEVSADSDPDTAGTGSNSGSNGRPEEATSCQKSLSLPENSSANIHLANLNSARGSLTGMPIGYRLPCTASINRTCQIVHHLPIWNEFLCKLHLELQELPSGQLSLSSLYYKNHFFKSTHDEQHWGVTLLHWLLKMHSCVVVVNLECSACGTHKDIVNNALKNNSFIKSLTIFSWSVYSNKDLCMALPTLYHLEEFECAGVPCSNAELSASMSLLLRRLMSLRCLKISMLHWENDNSVREFVEALMTHSLLKELSIHESVVTKALPATGQLFAYYVQNSLTLQTFTVEAYYRPYQFCLCALLAGLVRNRSITKLCLKDFPIDGCAGKLIPLILEGNDVLRSFIATSGNRYIGEPLRSDHSPACLLAFLQNDALEEVTLPVHIWQLVEWEKFFRGLPQKASLKNVVIEMDAIEYPLIPRLSKALKESGADGKVQFRDKDILYHQVKLEGRGLSELYIAPHSETRGEQMLRVIGQLPLCDSVTSIDLKINLSDAEESMFPSLGKYIRLTMALKKFRLCCTYNACPEVPDGKTNGFWTLVLQSLCQNRSIREVAMRWWYVEEELVKDLTDMIRTSRNICKVYFCTPEQCLANAFIRGLYESIMDNYKLIKVTLEDKEYDIIEKEWFAVSTLARRNFGLVTQAAQCVTGAACDRRRLQAMERVSHYPTLMEEVAELASISETEAVAKIQAQLRSFESLHDYMRATGVVKEKVICHPRGDGRTQLDNLNVYCWSRVRHYLLLEDVKQDVASPASEPTQQMCEDEQH